MTLAIYHGNGYVGIGTNSPTYILTMGGGAYWPGRQRLAFAAVCI